MIVSAVVCPQAPLLFRELSGAEDAVPELRLACLEAVTSMVDGKGDGKSDAGIDVVVVVGGADAAAEWGPEARFDPGIFGRASAAAPSPGSAGVPLSLGVGRHLLDRAGWAGPVQLLSVSWRAAGAEVSALVERIGVMSQRAGLLVLADGSTRRGEKAPGYLDERAFAYDDAVARALESGDHAALASMDPELADDLMVRGRAPLAVLAQAVGVQVAAGDRASISARLLHRDDPYGVDYTVALWHLDT